MTTAKDALAALGITEEETEQLQEEMKQQTRRDPRICLCGHPMSRHSINNGIGLCELPKSTCNCKFERPVLRVGDTRLFLRNTTGHGPEHALTRGIVALATAGKEAEWLIPIACDKCGTEEGRIVPMALTDRSVLICENCIMEIR